MNCETVKLQLRQLASDTRRARAALDNGNSTMLTVHVHVMRGRLDRIEAELNSKPPPMSGGAFDNA